MDLTVADRVVVVSALGGEASGGTTWVGPTASRRLGGLDRRPAVSLIQVNGYYEQARRVTPARVADLPGNAFGRGWRRRSDGKIYQIAMSAIRFGVLAVGVPIFVTAVGREVVDTSAAFMR